MNFTIFVADCVGNKSNCLYPNKMDISTSDQLKHAVQNDHVCASYANNYRSNGNFISSDVLVMDIDNDHTGDPAELVTEETLDNLFPDINYALVPSRHHMKAKGNLAAAPRYHMISS